MAKKKGYGEDFKTQDGFPIIGIVLSEYNWFRLMPTNTLIKLHEGKILITELKEVKKT